MIASPEKKHYFYLAPIRGITDALFRSVYHSHFPYFDAAVAPFINPQRFANFKRKMIDDVLPENNRFLPVVPQLLYNNSEDFINLGRQLQDLGYSHINWNLGCPAPMIANKQRGSGLLPFPERIIRILDDVLNNIDAHISIKTRLGFREADDIDRLLPQLERFRLKEIIIHPRIGKQLYTGKADQEAFARCGKLSRHRLVYNGDIITCDDFFHLATRFTDISTWMIGRGALGNPYLLAEILGEIVPLEEKRKKIHAFHSELYKELQERLSGPSHILGRMKQIWAYLIESFPEKKKVLKKIKKSSSLEKYQQAMHELFDD